MPSFDMKKKTLSYTSSDLTLLSRAESLLSIMAAHDSNAKQDATTAATAFVHLIKHVEAQRNGKAK